MYDNRGGQFWKYPFIALALVSPLVVLQFVHSPIPFVDFPFFLFFFIWILLTGVTVLATGLRGRTPAFVGARISNTRYT
jgi:hypothetical protein